MSNRKGVLCLVMILYLVSPYCPVPRNPYKPFCGRCLVGFVPVYNARHAHPFSQRLLGWELEMHLWRSGFYFICEVAQGV